MAIKATLKFGRYLADVTYSPSTVRPFPYLSYKWRSRQPALFSHVCVDARDMAQSQQFKGVAWSDMAFREGLLLDEKAEAHWMAEALQFIAAAAKQHGIKVTVGSDDFAFDLTTDLYLETGDLVIGTVRDFSFSTDPGT